MLEKRGWPTKTDFCQTHLINKHVFTTRGFIMEDARNKVCHADLHWTHKKQKFANASTTTITINKPTKVFAGNNLE